MDICKFNDLCINGLKAVPKHFGETCTPSFGGSFQIFLKACNALQIAINKLIYNNFNPRIAA
jgi:hypothetical protein